MTSNFAAYNALVEAAEKWPNNVAIYDDTSSVTFIELFEKAEILKQELLDKGISSGMAIGAMSKNSKDFIVAIFGIIATGACVMPMSHKLKRAEIDEIIKEAGLHAIVDEGSGATPLQASNSLENLPQFNVGFIEQNKNKPFAEHVDNPAFMRFTSGTTGKAKGVIISHSSAIERVKCANKLLQLGTDDTVIWVLPIAYHFVVSILLYVKYGAAIAITKDFLPENIIDVTKKHNGTLLYASPLQIRLLANYKGKASLNSLHTVISTSAGIAASVCVDFQEKYNIPVSQAYGIIEIGLPIINHKKSKTHPEAVGYSLPDYDVKIMDENNAPLPDGKVGSLAVKGPGMFNAYLNPPISKEEATIDGYFYTADFASMSEDGLITVEGRQKSVINITGNKVFPEEIEALIDTYPNILHSRVAAEKHPLAGQIVIAEVVLKNKDVELDTEALLTFCRKQLSTFKVPQKVYVVDKLAMTKTGKIVRV